MVFVPEEHSLDLGEKSPPEAARVFHMLSEF